MNKFPKLVLNAVLLLSASISFAQKIDRKSLVSRHNVVVNTMDTLSSLTVGNGKFAFTVDATGLQSFPEYYTKGVPLGTQSEWGWHTFPNPDGLKFSETLRPYDFNDKKAGLYSVQFKEPERNKKAVEYFRENPARLQLGNIGLEIIKKDGSIAKPQDIVNIKQVLNLWTGEITSNFKVEGQPVSVITIGDAVQDLIAVNISSPLLKEKRIKIRFRFPYPTNAFADMGTNYKNASSHQTDLSQPTANSALFSRKLDDDKYFVKAQFNGKAVVSKVEAHYFTLLPAVSENFQMSVSFASNLSGGMQMGFPAVKKSSEDGWKKFWLSGAAVDFSGSTDKRANELERRVILSQYLTRVQCAGNFPPQETGLTYNSWYGKPHMEMYWWHGAHYALWNRTDLLEKSMQWYFDAYDGAADIARRQGFKGVRWQKMTDHPGVESPSSVGSFLIWQQPHAIYLAELIYRNNPSKAVLQKYQKLIFGSAEFMASFAYYDPATKFYNLGKGIIPAQECYNPVETFNSPYELAYWKWALQVAQQWRSRLGMQPDKNWQDVIDKIAPLSQKDGLYSAAQSVEDSYSPESKFTIDHPAVLAALSTLPANGYVDKAIMQKTYDKIEKVWHWERTWGWDFPLIAMTATRLGQPEDAVDALFKNITTNTYLPNGHNYQDKRLTIYLPGNGGILAAVALMCAGSDDIKTQNPGFPKNGKWNVKWEGLKKQP
ncbi:hypothetical protein [Dyadobacter psychrotolerans]|uniref:Glycoside hydrolase family 65 n=1 Tax=Dyadobacter psychrotolerans TaxID=2541721 RepID=A0A4R5DXL5_9BACT|nr:hypothetical protein [Dyadobacter psychrotolerans]TDE17210.1 hypothetical protein E0F88_04740 [Dyadobacter psychrotolerans]